MKAVILAAGEGTRLRPLTHSFPKVMIPIANKPILEYVIIALKENGICDITMVVGYKKERIMTYFEDGKDFGVSINYVRQDKQLGTAHALAQAKSQVKGDDFLVLPGDNIVKPEAIAGLLKAPDETALLISESGEASKYGVVFTENQRVVKIVEKPEFRMGNLISTGIYKFTEGAISQIDEIREMTRTDLTSLIQYKLMQHEKISAVYSEGWADAVHPWDLLHLNGIAIPSAKTEKSGTVEANVILKGPVFIGEGSIIRSGSYIAGPVVIGEGCEIGPNVCIYPSTSIGNNVKIEPFTFIKNSILMSNILLGASSYLSNSVIGDGVSIGPQFAARSGKTKIQSVSEPERLYLVDDMGVTIGGDVDIGFDVTTEPGTIIGADSTIDSKARLAGKLENGSRILS